MLTTIKIFFRRAIYSQLSLSQVANWWLIKITKTAAMWLSLLLTVAIVFFAQSTYLGSFQYLAILALFGLVLAPISSLLVASFGVIRVVLIAYFFKIVALLGLILFGDQGLFLTLIAAILQALAINLFAVSSNVAFSEINKINKIFKNKLLSLKIEMALNLGFVVVVGLAAIWSGVKAAAVGILVFTLVSMIFWFQLEEHFPHHLKLKSMVPENTKLLAFYFMKTRQGIDLVVNLVGLVLVIWFLLPDANHGLIFINWWLLACFLAVMLVIWLISRLTTGKKLKYWLVVAGSVTQLVSRLFQASTGFLGRAGVFLATSLFGSALLTNSYQHSELMLANTVGARIKIYSHGLVAKWAGFLMAVIVVGVCLLEIKNLEVAVRLVLIGLAVVLLVIDGLIVYLERRQNGF